MHLKSILHISIISIISLAACGGLVQQANAQTARLYATTGQLRTLLNRIETRTDSFQAEVDRSYSRNNRIPENREDRIETLISRFENATDTLKVRANSRQTLTGDVNEVFNRASRINAFVRGNQLNSTATSQWSGIRTDLNTLARYYRISWNWNDTTPSVSGDGPRLHATTRQLRTILGRIERGTNTFQAEVLRSFAVNNDRVSENREDRIENLIANFENATDTLKVRSNAQQTLTGEVDEVFNRAGRINSFVSDNRLNQRATNQWSSIRRDLNTLASYYRMSWNWNQTPPVDDWTRAGVIEGTYRLNVGRSDNVSDVIEQSLNSSTAAQRNNWRQNLERRLDSPQMLAIDVNGNNVTLASSDSPRVSFEANGRGTRETNPRGRTVTTTATLRDQSLQINYVGDRTNDFSVSFAPAGPDQLTVTKRIYLEGRNDMVTVRSVYDRTSKSANWSAVGNGSNWSDSVASDNFLVPNGTRITTRLLSDISTEASQLGDRVRMTVISPSRYRGAVIEGRIAEVENSGRFTGRANLSISFDTIRMNGKTYPFAGMIDSVRAVNGETVSVNKEGVIRDRSQTTKTATRAGIGAILGGIIGAIADGGSGAAIGAGIGAGAGAGSILIAGSDSFELATGSNFDITASAPLNGRVGRN